MYNGKKSIILGVTSGIAIYKSADLCSKLVAKDYDVMVVMTPNARKLMSDRIFMTLSRNPVYYDMFAEVDWKPSHISLAERADLLLVAPCTANFIGKYSNGIADDMLSTVAIAHRKKVLLAPAMNTWMWQSPVIKMNCERLASWGVEFVGPADGRLACGTEGAGRMSEVSEIIEKTDEILK